MSLFESFNETTDKASNIGERYVKTSHQYFKLKAFKHLSSSLSFTAKLLIIGGLFFVGLVFASIALAFYFRNLTESIVLGFVLVGIIYFVIGLIFYFLRNHITKKVITALSSKFYK